MRKILVLRGGALGDFIVTLPALAMLRESWPDARIELAGNATAAQLARARGLLDAAHSQHEARWSGLFGGGALPSEFSDWLASFDLVINYWPDPDGDLARRFPTRRGQIFLSAPAMPDRGPAAAHYCEPLRALQLEPSRFYYALVPSSTDPRSSLPIALHPGSGSPRKNWPAENWRRVIDRLDAPLALVLGEAEDECWGGFSPARSSVTRLHRLPLEALVTQLSRSRLFVGHDSGISHLAAACGTPCVLLFGPTEPAVWAPPAPHVRVLRRGREVGEISVDEVLDAVREALADRT